MQKVSQVDRSSQTERSHNGKQHACMNGIEANTTMSVVILLSTAAFVPDLCAVHIPFGRFFRVYIFFRSFRIYTMVFDLHVNKKFLGEKTQRHAC